MSVKILKFLLIILNSLVQIPAKSPEIIFQPSQILLKMGENAGPINVTVKYNNETDGIERMILTSSNALVAGTFDQTSVHQEDGIFMGQFNVTGNFLGRAKISVYQDNSREIPGINFLEVTVIKEKDTTDVLFNISVTLVVIIVYISFGSQLDWCHIKGILKRPVGPLIGILNQVVFLPLVAFTIGHNIFPTHPELAIGLFFTGVCPSGGSSSIWSLLLGGNVNLSITMVTVSTFVAFGNIPLWLFTLGRPLFNQANIGVPYTRLATFAALLVIPILIGAAAQKFYPRITKYSRNFLKTVGTCLIIYVIIFAVFNNLYLFSVFSWKVLFVSVLLPWSGFAFGLTISKLFKQERSDCLTVAIETGMLNTNIAIYLLTFTLPEPEADLAKIIPIGVKLVAHLPMIFLLVCQKIFSSQQKGPMKIPLIKNAHES